MKITFVYPDVQPQFRFWKGMYYSGIGTLSAFLKHHGHAASLIHITSPITKDTFIDHIMKEKPDLIGFSSTSHSFPIVKRLTSWINKEGLQIPVICGGIHATICPDETIKTEGIDMVCRGEGEEALLELCNALDNGRDIKNILNIWFKDKGNVHKNPLRPPYRDLNKLPFCDRAIFNYRNLFHENYGFATVMVSRGCPYNCSYCSNHALRNLYDQNIKYTRFMDVDRAISEIKQITRDHPFIKGIHFDDDILFLNKKWAEEFMMQYRDNVGLPFHCNARPNLINEKTVSMMSQAGCVEISIGLEAGNDYIRNKVLKRNLSREQIINAFRLCKEKKIRIKSFNMVGLPYEDSEKILDTLKLNAEIHVDEIQATIFQPYPGTELFDLCSDKGFLVENDLPTDFFSPSPVLLDTVTPGQVLMFRDYFKVFVRIYRLLNILPKPVSGIAVKLMDRFISFKYTSSILNKVYIPLNFLYRLIQ